MIGGGGGRRGDAIVVVVDDADNVVSGIIGDIDVCDATDIPDGDAGADIG